MNHSLEITLSVYMRGSYTKGFYLHSISVNRLLEMMQGMAVMAMCF